MPRLSQKLWLLCALLAVAAGCKPKVGDDCRLSTDCSAAGDRYCDITSPGGYCFILNCEPDTCPEDESLCVQFGAQRSPIAACVDKQSPSPYARAFCMATCDEDSDCRPGYTCANLSPVANPWGAVLIDRDRGNRACLVPISQDALISDPGAADSFGDVCRSELPPATPASGGSATGGTAAGGAATGGTAAGGTSGGATDGGAAGQGGAGG